MDSATGSLDAAVASHGAAGQKVIAVESRKHHITIRE